MVPPHHSWLHPPFAQRQSQPAPSPQAGINSQRPRHRGLLVFAGSKFPLVACPPVPNPAQGSLNSFSQCCHSLAKGTTGNHPSSCLNNPQLHQLEMEFPASPQRSFWPRPASPWLEQGWEVLGYTKQLLGASSFRSLSLGALLTSCSNHESSQGLYLENTLLVSVIKPM